MCGILRDYCDGAHFIMMIWRLLAKLGYNYRCMLRNVYWTLLNIHPAHRSTLHSWQLLVLILYLRQW